MKLDPDKKEQVLQDMLVELHQESDRHSDFGSWLDCLPRALPGIKLFHLQWASSMLSYFVSAGAEHEQRLLIFWFLHVCLMH